MDISTRGITEWSSAVLVIISIVQLRQQKQLREQKNLLKTLQDNSTGRKGHNINASNVTINDNSDEVNKMEAKLSNDLSKLKEHISQKEYSQIDINKNVLSLIRDLRNIADLIDKKTGILRQTDKDQRDAIQVLMDTKADSKLERIENPSS